MLLRDVVDVSARVASESGRSAKRDLIAEVLGRTPAEDIPAVVGFLSGELRQGRVGIGWRTLQAVSGEPVATASLTVSEVDAMIDHVGALSGPGSTRARQAALGDVMARATEPEQRFLVDLLAGGVRQGALAGVMTDAVARAAGVPVAAVRRAEMLGGRQDDAAVVALTDGVAGLERIGLRVGRPVMPMLASTAATVIEALDGLGSCAVEWKLDGIRVQVHKDGHDVRVFSRNLNELTERLPGVVAATRTLAARSAVLDGEALMLDDGGRPRLFQDTVSWRGENDRDEPAPDAGLRPWFFDLLHLDGTDLIDAELGERRALLHDVAGAWVIPGQVTDDPTTADGVLAAALAAGHEGVVVKAMDSVYAAGRRGKTWRKVKPVHTLDLVVLGVEWGSGRRRGTLSNIHLGARAADGDGFVMVGKTFKGMTDEMLAWQTERFLELRTGEESWGGERTGVVWVQPVQVVEIALDGVQRSTRYPGGVALRFARVLRYRHDKDAAEADSITTVAAMLAGTGPVTGP